MDEKDWKLPASYVHDGMELAKDGRLFGVSLTDLSRDELLAAAAHGWKAYADKMKEQGEAFKLSRRLRANIL